MFGKRAFTLLSGRPLRRERRLIVPHFQGDALKALGDMIRDATLEAFETCRPERPSWSAAGRSMSRWMSFWRTVLGADTPARCTAFRDAVRALTKGYGNPTFLMLAAMQIKQDWPPPFRRFTAIRRRLEDLLQDAVDRARQEGLAQAAILNRVVAARYEDGTPMPDEAIKDNMITTLIAGHETSVSIAVLGALLAASRPALSRAAARRAASHSAPTPIWRHGCACPYLDAVVKEVLRLWPVVTDINRVLAQPMHARQIRAAGRYDRCGGVGHPALRPRSVSEPDTFRPERFIGRRFGPHEYLAFGGGERMCPGSHLAVFELKIVLATLLTRYRYTLLDEGSDGGAPNGRGNDARDRHPASA